MANYLIMAALVLVVALALKSSLKHFRGGGGCCGGGESVVATKKDFASPCPEKILVIGGMSCENCAARVQNALNSLDGVAASVSLKNNCARVKCARPISDDELRGAVSRAGYEVVDVRDA